MDTSKDLDLRSTVNSEHPNNEQSTDLLLAEGNAASKSNRKATLFDGYVRNEMDMIKELQINMGKGVQLLKQSRTQGSDQITNPNNYLIQQRESVTSFGSVITLDNESLEGHNSSDVSNANTSQQRNV